MSTGTVVTCPGCAKKFRTKSDMSGKKIKCPACAKIIAVPAANGQAEAEPVAMAVAAPAPPPVEEEDNDDPYAVKNQDLKARCPNCANEMEDEKAVICLHCGYNTLTREWGRTEKVIGSTGGDYIGHLLPGVLSFLFAVLMVAFLLYYCVVAPLQFHDNKWINWTDRESLHMWAVFICMSIIWSAAFFAYKRLLVNPRPLEVKKE